MHMHCAWIFHAQNPICKNSFDKTTCKHEEDVMRTLETWGSHMCLVGSTHESAQEGMLILVIQCDFKLLILVILLEFY